ncbi:MAG: molybdopterin synthase [Haloferacaceae archaeon]
MQPLGVVGTGAEELLDDLATRLDGRVATVRRESIAEERGEENPPSDATASYVLGEDGTWSARGRQRTLPELLDDLAPEYDYLLVAGFPNARVPTVVLGERSAERITGEVLLEAADAAAVDLDALIEALVECEPHVTLESLVERAKASPHGDRAGAIATFTGRVRAKDAPDDSRTEYLEFEKYEGVAEQRMAEIEDELAERDGVFEVLMYHRVGVIEDGEDIVFVVVLAGHREEAFRTVEDGIDRLKAEVPIFKKESTTDEEFWVHEQP